MGGFPKTSENKYLSEIEEDGQKRWIYKSILKFEITNKTISIQMIGQNYFQMLQ